MSNFAPSIKISDTTVYPKGYVWILGFALGGCEWAIKKASEPEFLALIRADLAQEELTRLETLIAQYEVKITELKNSHAH